MKFPPPEKLHHYAAMTLVWSGLAWMFLPAGTFDELLFHKIDAWGMIILGNVLLLTEKL